MLLPSDAVPDARAHPVHDQDAKRPQTDEESELELMQIGVEVDEIPGLSHGDTRRPSHVS